MLMQTHEARLAVELAQLARNQGRRTILFVDEVHRFNKSQQDAFLPYVESGTITFIGATTENPSFELNAAVLSRSQVMVLERLTLASLELLAQRGNAQWYTDPINHAGFGHIADRLFEPRMKAHDRLRAVRPWHFG